MNRRRPTLARRTAVLALIAAQVLAPLGVVGEAQAKVDPLAVIKRQINKANVLIVLDTSGSMTGVPGGEFANSTEVGVDCDNGQDCRGWNNNSACNASQCAPQLFAGTCPAGFMPDINGTNFIQNPDFNIWTGSTAGKTVAAFNALYPTVRFRTGVPYAGDDQYPGDTLISIIHKGRFTAVRSGYIDASTGQEIFSVDQSPFGGDPCFSVPATANALYANGNSTGAPYKIWEQDVTIDRNATYVFAAYISNMSNPKWGDPKLCATWPNCTPAQLAPWNNPRWRFKRNGVNLHLNYIEMPQEVMVDGTDRWTRVQSAFTASAGAGTETVTLSLWNEAVGNVGDDAAVTQMSLRKCVPIPSGAGRCTVSGDTCGGATTCPGANRCSQTGEQCATAGTACQAVGTCQGTTQTCSTSADCPPSGPGTCSLTGQACTGSCPQQSTCLVGGQVCATSQDCPLINGKRCLNNLAKPCNGSGDCNGWWCIPINLPNWCLGAAANVCNVPRLPCNTTANTCTAVGNVCAAGQSGSCGDTRLEVKMCQTALTICKQDSDCPAGDTCGAPTSRAVIAKRVLRRLVEETHDLVNFGLMTYYHTGYYPYYSGVTAAPAGAKSEEFFTKLKLSSLGCYDATTGPAATCTIYGKTYALRGSGAPSRYWTQIGGGKKDYRDTSFCGELCAVPGAGLGEFVGAFYDVSLTHVGVNAGGRTTMSDYQGRNRNSGGVNRVYYTPNPSYYNNGERPYQSAGFQFNECGNTNQCGQKCGGLWDSAQVPFLDVTGDTANARTTALAISDRLQKAKFGGLVTYSGTPTGCTLENSGVTTNKERYSAYHYMEKVLANVQAAYSLDAATAKTCRPNYVLLVTDGAANGPGDSNCTAAACAADDPEAAGCTCKAVLAAWRMRKNLGVRTLVVGFSGDVASGAGAAINENIARAGGTDAALDEQSPYAHSATSEDELLRAMRAAVFEAARGSYATAPPTASAGAQEAAGVQTGKYLLDARVDFPAWQGHLIAYDATDGTPDIIWDAAVRMKERNWWERRVYVGSSSGPVKIAVDPNTKEVTNKAALHTLGLGSTQNEAADIARWLLGDPKMGNPAVLGAIVNSTPIDVGPPGLDMNFKGGKAFYEQYKTRPNLIYVGASDGMLHAFFAKDTVVGGSTYPGGTEAFAYLPKSMLPKVQKLYAQGGQDPDPEKHIFGLANSAKVKSICTANCNADNATWKTVLVMSAGFGGTETFVLDITNPVTTSAINDPPFTQLWSTVTSPSASTYENALGQTISVPAFSFNRTTSMDDFRLVLASGYRADPSKTNQGRRILYSSIKDGAIQDEETVYDDRGCSQEYTSLTDVATARDHKQGYDTYSRLLSAYLGDTHGTLWRYDGNGSVNKVVQLGCEHPLHFAPTVVQLDRDSINPQTRGEVYIAQVTNSSLDVDTVSLPTSKLVVLKDKAAFDDVNKTFSIAADNLGGLSKIEVAVTSMCAEYAGSNCTKFMPASARPAGTPTALVLEGGAGFKLLSFWYAPSVTRCDKGTTYMAVHEFRGDAVTQKMGLTLANEAVLGAVVVNDKVYAATASGLINVSGLVGLQVRSLSSTAGQSSDAGRFRSIAWTEIP